MADRYDQDLILDYVEGDLSPADRVRFEATLASDAVLRELTQKLAADRAALRALPDQEPPAQLLDDALQQLERGMLLGDADDGSLVAASSHARRLFVGRVLAYSGLAAVLVLTCCVLISMLTDVDLLDTADQYAQVGRWFEQDRDPAATRANERLALLNERRSQPAPAGEASESDLPAATALDREALTMGDLAIADGPALGRRADGGAAGDSAAGTVAGWSTEPDGPFAWALVSPARADSTPLRIEVATRDERQTRQDVLDWAMRNNVVVIAPRSAAIPTATAKAGERTAAAMSKMDTAADASAGAEAPVGASTAMKSADAPSEPVLVRLRRDEQVPQLIEYLNRYETQRASVAGPDEYMEAEAAMPLAARAVSAPSPAPSAPPALQTAAGALDKPTEPLRVFDTQTAEAAQAPAAPGEAAASDRAGLPAAAAEVTAAEPAVKRETPGAAEPTPLAETPADATDAGRDQISLFQQLIEERNRALRAREEASRQGNRSPALPDWLDPMNLKVLPPVALPDGEVVTAAIYITESDLAGDEH